MRATKAPAVRRKHKKILKGAEGYWGARSRWYRLAKQALIRSGVYAYAHRRQRKSMFRRLWILRINAALHKYGLKYSRFIYALRRKSVKINRQQLSYLATKNKEAFEKLVKIAKTQF